MPKYLDQVSDWPTLNSDAMVPPPRRALLHDFSISWIVMAARHLAFWFAVVLCVESVYASIVGSQEETSPVVTALVSAAVIAAAYWPLKFHLWPWWGQLLASVGMLVAGFAAWAIHERRSDED